MYIILKIFAFILGGNVVALQDFQGESSLSISFVDPFDIRYCRAYFLTGVGHCVLLDGGKVSEECESSYIKTWRFV